jgi:succinate dehydrogenase / fumarate reductase cytochrome b subunit
LNWLKAFFVSSVGRKYVMGATGLFLCFFLVVHLAGNLLLYVGEETYNDYAHKLHSTPEFLYLAETLLYAALGLHIAFAVCLQFENWEARPQRYAFAQSKRKDRVLSANLPTPDKTMFLTGLIALLFIIVHVSDFKFEIGWHEALGSAEPFAKARIIVSNWLRVIIYLIGSTVLGIHVMHGLQSAFQSLGWNHSKYMPTIRYLSWIFGLVVIFGFGSFPVMAVISGWK